MPPTEDTSIKIQTITNKLIGLHFGLKSHTIWITNVISEHNYMKLCTITTILHLFGDCNFLPKKKKGFNRKIFKIRNTKASLFFIFLKFDWLLQTALEVWLVGFSDAFSLAGKKVEFREQIGAIPE